MASSLNFIGLLIWIIENNGIFVDCRGNSINN